MMNTFCVLFCLVALLVALAAARDVAVYSSFEEHAQASQDYFNQRTAQLKAAGGVGSSVAGVDFSTSLSVSTLKCIANEGFEGFAIPRGYCSYGGVDSHMVTNVANAHSAGFKAVDVYFFPCVTCSKTAAQQFDELWNTFTNQKVNVGMVWFDAESASTTGTKAQNQAFIQAWLARAAQFGAKVGIYSSRYMWGVCYGDSFRLSSTAYPTWYALYNNNGSNCSDYASYTWGGFPKANIKQWAGDKTLCGAGIDKNILC